MAQGPPQTGTGICASDTLLSTEELVEAGHGLDAVLFKKPAQVHEVCSIYTAPHKMRAKGLAVVVLSIWCQVTACTHGAAEHSTYLSGSRTWHSPLGQQNMAHTLGAAEHTPLGHQLYVATLPHSMGDLHILTLDFLMWSPQFILFSEAHLDVRCYKERKAK